MAGQLWRLIEAHMDKQRYRPSERQVAAELGITQQGMSRWKAPVGLPARENLVAIARLTGVPYRDVLDAALADIGYIETRAGEGSGEQPAANTPPPLTAGEWDQMYAELERQGVSPRMIRQQLPPRPTGGPPAGEVGAVTSGDVAGHGGASRRAVRGA